MQRDDPELRASFAEKYSYNHIQLLQHSAFLSRVQQLMYYQRDEQHLNGDKSYIPHQIDEDMMCVFENAIMGKVQSRG